MHCCTLINDRVNTIITYCCTIDAPFTVCLLFSPIAISQFPHTDLLSLDTRYFSPFFQTKKKSFHPCFRKAHPHYQWDQQQKYLAQNYQGIISLYPFQGSAIQLFPSRGSQVLRFPIHGTPNYVNVRVNQIHPIGSSQFSVFQSLGCNIR